MPRSGGVSRRPPRRRRLAVRRLPAHRFTGFSNAEETQLGLAQKAKWTLQDRLVALGAKYTEGEPWAPHVVVDRNLHTGQNPASAGPLAVEVLVSLT